MGDQNVSERNVGWTNGVVVRKAVLVLLLIPMVLFAFRPMAKWPARLIEAVPSPDGSVWVSLHREEVSQPEVWRWDQDLRGGERFATFLCEPYPFRTMAENRILIVLGQGQIMGYSTASKQRVWGIPCDMSTNLASLDDGEHLLLLERSEGRARVLHAETGRVVDEWELMAGVMQRCYFQSNTLVITGDASYVPTSDFTLRWTGTKLEELTGAEADRVASNVKADVENGKAQFWDYAQHMVRNTLESGQLPNGNSLLVLKTPFLLSEELRVVAPPEGTVVRRKVLSSRHQPAGAWSLGLPAIYVCFVALLVWDGTHSANPRRFAIDSSILCLVYSLPFIAWQSDLMPEHIRSQQSMRFLPMLLAWFVSGIFFVLAGTNRRLYFWASILVSSLFVFFLPSVLLAFACRWFGIESPIRIRDQAKEGADRKMQFGIGDVMIGTAAIAIFLSFGVSMVELMVGGLGGAVVLLLGLPALKYRALAWGWLAMAAVLSCMAMMLTKPETAAYSSIHWMVLMVFAVVSLYRVGSRSEQEPAAIDLAEEPLAEDASQALA
ncbi:MAG: hypothetical protein AAFX06_06460 [Planctomycetota bacterium]